MRQQDLPAIGAPLQGGFFAGVIGINSKLYAQILAPKKHGQVKLAWHPDEVNVPGALSFFDGLANTAAMREAGSPIASWVTDFHLDGHTDWHIPSRDQLELLYRHFKPTARENFCLSGDNPSSSPVGYAYSLQTPAQTELETFRKGGEEAFDDAWYWSSTQYAGVSGYAWNQFFDYGSQLSYAKSCEARVRAVRLIQLTA